jgi:type I restriction enzyme S subunit
VGEVLSLERRQVAVDIASEYSEIGVRSFGRGIFHKEPISGAELGSKRVFAIEPGDLVLSNVFAWEGAVAVASEAESGRIGSHRFMTFVPVDDRISTAWAAWFFSSEPGLELIQKASPGSAGRNRTLAVKRFEALDIPLPPIEEQRRVARLLDAALDQTTALAHLHERSRTIAAAAQISLTQPGSERESPDWFDVELGQVMQPSTARVEVDPSAEYRLSGVYSFGRGLIDRGHLMGSDTSYKTLMALAEGDVVMSKLNGWEGAVAVVDDAFAGSFVSPEFPVFKLDTAKLVPGFFHGVARSPNFWSGLNAVTRGSMVRRRRISANDFLGAVIRLPSLKVQSIAARQLRSIDHIAARSAQRSERVSALVPALLNREFSRL